MRRIVTAALGLALTTAACGTSSAAAPTWTFAPPTTAAAPATNQPTPTPTGSPEVLSTAIDDASTTAPGSGGGGATDGPVAAVAPATAAVRIANFEFTPASLTVQAGGQVTWTNTDGDRHSILLDGSESPRLEQNATFSRTFASPARFAYVCGLHSSMSGEIVVVPAGSPGSAAGDPGSTTGGAATTPSGTATPDATAAPTAGSDDHGGDDDDADDDSSGPGSGHDNDDDDDGEDEDEDGDEDHSGPGGGRSGHG